MKMKARETKMSAWLLLGLVGLLLGVGGGVAVAAEAGFLECRVLPIPHFGDWHSGSGYTALECDLEGNVYIGAANYGYSASLVQYRPETGEFRLIARMHDLFNLPLNGTKIDTQSKIHSELCRDAEGRIYGGTKQGNEIFDTRPEYGEDPKGFPGGRLFVYDPATGEIRDLGAGPLPQEGFEGGAIDRERMRLYYNSCPKHHLIIYDIASGRFADKGEIDSSARYNVVAPDGRVFWPGWNNNLVMFDPETDDVYELRVRWEGPGDYQTYPYAFTLGPDGTKIYGANISGQWVHEYDLSTATFESISGRGVCRTTPEPFKSLDIHTMITGPDGRVYWTADDTSRDVNAWRVHLMRYDPKTGEAQDLGILRDSTWAEPQRAAEMQQIAATGAFKAMDRWDKPHLVSEIQGSAFAPDGTLYLKRINRPYALVIVPKDALR